MTAITPDSSARTDGVLQYDGDASRAPLRPPVLSRVVLKNYKSIQSCEVNLSPLTLLVGPNGAGKSNFVDGIRITSDALNANLENAVRERGGINEVRRRSRGHPTHFGVRLDVNLDASTHATYAYQVAARQNQTFEVQREDCKVWSAGRLVSYFEAESGAVRSPVLGNNTVRIAPNSLALAVLGAYSEFNPLVRTISSFGYYRFNLDAVRGLQNPDAGRSLAKDGSNLSSVVRFLSEHAPDTLGRIADYLASVVPGIRSVQSRTFGPKESIEFRQEVAGDEHPWRYLASNVSDGTLRALGVLVAVFQESDAFRIPLVALEEPEVAIHPGAALRLMDALLEAATRRQLVLTTHSPDLLDHQAIDVDSVVAVQSERGSSKLGPVAESTREIVRENLYTVGELLRLEQVWPDIFRIDLSHPTLF